MCTYHIILDLEMNPVCAGMAPDGRELKTETIEIGAVKISAETNRIVDEFTCVVCPQWNHQVEPNITRLTGITTREARTGKHFADALVDFSNWVGSEPVQIYSWSPSDYLQLRGECAAKGIAFPAMLKNWVDFQAEYPKYLGYSKRRCLSLKDAAQMIGTTILPGRAHRALYDAQITARLVLFALTGEYRHYKANSGQSAMTYSIGEACGGKLTALLERLRHTKESEVCQHGTRSIGTTEAPVR